MDDLENRFWDFFEIRGFWRCGYPLCFNCIIGIEKQSDIKSEDRIFIWLSFEHNNDLNLKYI